VNFKTFYMGVMVVTWWVNIWKWKEESSLEVVGTSFCQVLWESGDGAHAYCTNEINAMMWIQLRIHIATTIITTTSHWWWTISMLRY
jgi:hypothetical protein